MGDYLDQLLFLQPILQRVIEVKPQLFRTLQSDERRNDGETAATLGISGRSQISPKRTQSVKSASFGAKSAIVF